MQDAFIPETICPMGHTISGRSVRFDRLEAALKDGSFHHYCGECDALYLATDTELPGLWDLVKAVSDLEPKPEPIHVDPEHQAIRRQLQELVNLVKSKQTAPALSRLESLLTVEFDVWAVSVLDSELRGRYRSVGDKLSRARDKVVAGDAKGGVMTLELALAEFTRR